MRDWIEDKILSLADTFAIDVFAYAVMLFLEKHTHLALHVDAEKTG